jgi:hypothetical protein
MFNSRGRVASLRLGCPMVGCHLIASGQSRSAVFPVLMMEQLYRRDSVSGVSLVRAGCTTGR